MTKLMYALRGADVARLHGAELRTALAAAGAERLQVNVDDEQVAAALRIPAGHEPIGAVASVWTDGEPAAITGVLTDLAEEVAGWEVDERRPLDPPEAWDGCRADALANVAFLRRPAELAHDEWLHRWLVDHTPVAIATQAAFGYLQNVVLAPVTDGAPAVAAIVEELFAMAAIDDVHAFYGSHGDDAELADRLDALMASVTRIGADRDLELVPTSRFLHDLREEPLTR